MADEDAGAVDPAIWEARPLYADQFYVSTTDVIRLTFGEQTSDNATRYHTAVMMTRATVADLRDLLTKVLADEGTG